MRKYLKEMIILFIQLFMFYVFPLFCGPTDVMGMVILIILSVLLLSFIIGVISNKNIKYLYPIVIDIVFLPTIFIYYNESALIYLVWFLFISFVGLLIGIIINKFIVKN